MIGNAISQSFTATVNGSYAVIISQNGCTDTSSCQTVNNVGIIESHFGSDIKLYPNPNHGELFIDLGARCSNVTVTVKNFIGQEVMKEDFISTQNIDLKINGQSGIYFIEIIASGNKKALIKLIKE